MPHSTSTYHEMAQAIRFLTADAVQAAKSGHPGLPLGFADVATILWKDFLRFDPLDPAWENRDRVVLSAGHGSMLLYSILYLCGYKKMTIEEIKRFRKLESLTPGHPELDLECGIEMATGPLGQGLAHAVGMALAQQWLRDRFAQNSPLDHKVYAIVGDGCLMEGISEEAIALAGHWHLKNLIVLFDDNQITIDGPTSLARSDDVVARFKNHGWATRRVDGHDYEAIHASLAWAQHQNCPTLLAYRTVIGWGAPTKKNSSACHGSPLGEEEIKAMRHDLAWPHPPFFIPEPIKNAWREIGEKHSQTRHQWQESLNAEQKQLLQRLKRASAVHPGIEALQRHASKLVEERKPTSTRIASQECIGSFIDRIDTVVGGSADLTGSNNTKAAGQEVYVPSTSTGSYLHYGVREHAMAGIMNGITLYGCIPYGGTFLAFSDYMRPSIRLAALMKCPTIFVFSHDSIGLGEDGPTHQPIEHLASLRAIPHLLVMRPADSVETAECWQIALQEEQKPSALCLSRQSLPCLRGETSTNLSQYGGYILLDIGDQQADIIFVASGSEVSLAVESAQALWQERQVPSRVVSMPCQELWLQQNVSYQEDTLGQRPRIVIEAGIQQSWDSILRPQDRFIGLRDFGASAPGPDIYKHFALTREHVLSSALEILSLQE